jgi:hypothetical protein
MNITHIEAPPKSADVPLSVMSLGLSSHIRNCWEEALSTKQELTERLLRCERQRRGEYDPEMRMLIEEQGGASVFMMLSDVKCRAAEAWIKDVMLSADRTWTLAPTSEPSVPNELRDAIVNTVMTEAMQAAGAGMGATPAVIGIRINEVYDEVLTKISEKTKEATAKMTRKMDDILEEAKWPEVVGDLVYDFVTYPFSVIKGPVVRRRRQLTWSKDFKPVVKDVVALDFERVSPYDLFWSPNATSPQDAAYIIERIKPTRSAVAGMKGLPNVNDEMVDRVLDQYGRGGLREWTYSETEQATLKGMSSIAAHSGDLIEGISFWGSVSGASLTEWGMKGLDPHKEYEINAWQFGQHTVLCKMNPDPLGRRPYSKRCWEDIPGAFAGMALPELMRDVQSMCNAAARALANNMALASGPMVEINIDRLAKGEEVSELHPLKIFQTTSDRSGSGQSAIRFNQPEMNAGPLLEVYTYFQKIADEVTGVPNYIYGSSAASGAGRTAAGLSMLMENAAKGIKGAILSLDRSFTDVLTRLYNHLMIYDKEPSIKSDAQIVATGVVATLMKDQIQARRAEFLAAVSNPVDLQIVTPDRRAYLLREQAKTLNLDIDKLVPKPEEMQRKQQMEQMQQQAMAQQQAMPQQGPPQQGMPQAPPGAMG